MEDEIRVLQCLSTFFISSSRRESTLALRHISEFTGFSLGRIKKLICSLDERGYVHATAHGASLDPEKWWERSDGVRMRRLAYYVAHAPEQLRGDDALQPLAKGCPWIPPPEPGCSVTITSNFTSVYSGEVARTDCCPPPTKPPIELLFERSCCVAELPASENLWFLGSAFNPGLFRRELFVLYSTGCDGRLGCDEVDGGGYDVLLVLLSDAVLARLCLDVHSSDLIAVRRQCGDVQIYETLSGKQLSLDPVNGRAHYELLDVPQVYKDRGRSVTGVRLVELS